MQTRALTALELSLAPTELSAPHARRFVEGAAIEAADIRIVRGIDAVLSLAARWLELEGEAGGHTFFQSYGWCRHVILHLSREGAIDPLAVTAWQEGRLVAIWPLRVVRSSGASVVSSLGWPYDQSSGILLLRDRGSLRLIQRMGQALRASGIADGMLLHKARRKDPICALVDMGAGVVDEGAVAPQVRIDTGAPFTSFLQGVSAKTRKNIRNYENRLARLGAVEHRVLTGAAAAEAIVASYDARRDWLDAKGMSSSAFRDPHFAGIVHGLARGKRVGLDLIVFALSLDGRMIALQWGFLHRRRYYAYLSARDPAFEAFSVGRIHLQHVLKECHARGIGDIDLMVPAAPYKTTWSSSADALVDLAWPWTLRGHLAIGLFARRVRPLLKAAVQALPASARRLLLTPLNARR